MTAYLLPGTMGLLLGLMLHWTGFSRTDGTRLALGLRRSYSLRSGLTAVGWAMALTALLCWLAVIDVDTIEVLPLSLGTLLGGAILGVSVGLCGFTPMSAFAGLGAGNALEALSILAGCFAGVLLLPSLDGLFAPLRTAPPYAAATLFKVTLDEPWLLSGGGSPAGGFLGQACTGLILAAAAMCIPSPRPVILTEEAISAKADEAAATEAAPDAAEAPVPEDEPAPEESPDPKSSPEWESAADDTFVAILEGEEPLVVDTDLSDEADTAELPTTEEAEPESKPEESAE